MPGLGEALGYAFDPQDAEREKELEREALATGMEGQGPSEMAGVKADPNAVRAQQAALQGLQDRVTGGGYNAGDRARIAGAESDMAQQNAGNMGAIAQHAAATGQANSGNAYAAQIANAQGEATRASKAGTEIAGQGQQQALQSLAAMGGLASGVRGQSFGEGAAKASAQDEINARNRAMRYGAQRDAAGSAANWYDRAGRMGSDIGSGVAGAVQGWG